MATEMTRGKLSRVTIAGHTLTWAELTVLNQLKGQLRLHASNAAGIGLREIFPGQDLGDTAKRYCVRHLALLGVLEASQIEFADDICKLKGQTT